MFIWILRFYLSVEKNKIKPTDWIKKNIFLNMSYMINTGSGYLNGEFWMFF